MSNWRLAKSLVKLREQINAAYPDRDKTSDGSVGDLSHMQRRSDHNPDMAGVVRAIDIDADLSPILNIRGLVDVLFNSKDPRIKYLIFNGRITEKGLTGWKTYHGANAHKHHCHISVSSDRGLYDDDTDWHIDDDVVPLVVPGVHRTLRKGDRGPDVMLVQERLKAKGWGVVVDGDFGEVTATAVGFFQSQNGLRADRIIGLQTWAKLNE